MTTRGVLYAYWGDKHKALAEQSAASLRRFHPDLPVTVHEMPAGSTLLDKAGMYDWSPYDTTLFLDTDTTVMGDLSYGFDMAERWGLALCLSENPWLRRHVGVQECGDLVEYNTGVIFWTRAAEPVFRKWHAYAPAIDSTVWHITPARVKAPSPPDDQAAFSKAVHDVPFNPFVLPPNFNFRPQWYRSFFGPLKVWHGYTSPPPGIDAYNAAQSKPGEMIRFMESR